VKSFPCEWRKWNAQQYPVGCDAEGCELAPATGTVPDQCQARFKCRASGLYMLELTVQDGCSSKSETVPVTCKCAQELQLNLIDAQVNLKRCRAGGARAFEDMSISASYGLTAAPRSQHSVPTMQRLLYRHSGWRWWRSRVTPSSTCPSARNTYWLDS